ncbi:trna pseudouridine synthase 1 [Nannochloropsis oceanica]
MAWSQQPPFLGALQLLFLASTVSTASSVNPKVAFVHGLARTTSLFCPPYLLSLRSSSISAAPGPDKQAVRRRTPRYAAKGDGTTTNAAIERPLLDMNGFVAVYKPKDWSSNDVVQKVRGVLEKEARQRAGTKVKVKVGHGGTLDPMATGVLVLGVGTACRDLSFYLKGSKAYRAVGLLGSEYDTMDSTGQITETVDVAHVTPETLEAALGAFRGNIMQRPPAFSALRKNGKRLYELARKGEVVEAEPRPVQVNLLNLVPAEEEAGKVMPWPHFGLEIECQGGTYVRSLISDLARTVDARAHMTALVRTKQGPFFLKDCLPEETWKTDAEAIVLQLVKK